MYIYLGLKSKFPLNNSHLYPFSFVGSISLDTKVNDNVLSQGCSILHLQVLIRPLYLYNTNNEVWPLVFNTPFRNWLDCWQVHCYARKLCMVCYWQHFWIATCLCTNCEHLLKRESLEVITILYNEVKSAIYVSVLLLPVYTCKKRTWLQQQK